MELFTTDSLSQKTLLGPRIGTPRYINVVLISTICSTYVLAATNSDEYVAVSAVDYFIDHQAMGVWFMKCNIPVTERPVRTS